MGHEASQQIEAQARKTRGDRWNDFWQVATPKLFEWFEWATVLGAMSYVNLRHPTVGISLLVGLGFAALIFYFGGFFARHHMPIPWIKNESARTLVSGLAAICLGGVTALLIEQAVFALSSGTP